MKRRILGIFAVLIAGLFWMLLTAPAATAESNGGGCLTTDTSTEGCIILVVHLSADPGSGATVRARRLATTGTDDNFTLNRQNNTTYSSINKVSGTNWDYCSFNGDHASNYFDIEVRNVANVIVGTANRVNLCRDLNDTSNIKNVNVTVSTPGTGPGGFEGKVTVEFGGQTRTCTNILLRFAGPTNKSVGADQSGTYNTGPTLNPGQYSVAGNCTIGAGTFAVNATNTVSPGIVKRWDIKALNGTEPTDGEVPKDPPPKCDAGGKGFTWIICGAIRTLVDFIDWVRDTIIVPFLEEKPLDKDAKEVAPMFAIWETFRNVASLLFILIFFLVILGTAIGWDNYTIKKALPRLVVATIMVPFSWYFCVAIIDIGNILGNGMVSLSAAVIPPAEIDFRDSWSKVLLGGMLVGAVATAAGAIAIVGWGIVISMALAILGVFLTLIFRKLLITTLIILSPFAFVFWVLPNTAKWFTVWRDNLIKLVLMFPLIMILFEAGRIFALAAGAFNGNQFENVTRPFMQLAAYVIPLFLVPWTFKWAGGGLELAQKGVAKATGMVDKRYGKNSEREHDRQHARQATAALKATDFNTNPRNNRALGAISRGIAAKRSGQAGFFHHANLGAKTDKNGNFVGNRRIPILSGGAAAKQRLNKAAAHAVDEEAESEAISHMREHQPQSSDDRIANISAGAYSRLFEQRKQEEALATKNKQGVSVQDIPVTSVAKGSAAEAEIRDARAEYGAAVEAGDATATRKAQVRLVNALQNSNGGVDQLEGIAMEEVFKGEGANKARVAAVLSRLATSQTGVDRAASMGSGFVEPDKDRPGHVKGGNGVNADGSRALFGGDDNSPTSAAWASTWSSGMGKATGLDIKKSLSAAVSDLSAEDISKASAPQMRRIVGYIDRNLQPGGDNKRALKARTTLNDAAAAALDSDKLKSKILVDTRNVIATASESPQPIIDPSLGARYRALIAEPPPPPVVPEHVAQQIIQATNGDVVHASQIHQHITQNMTGTDLRSSDAYVNIENHILENGALRTEDLPTVGAPAAPAPLPPGHVAPGDALGQRMSSQFKTNLDALAAAQQSYATDEAYRQKVDSAYKRGTNIPPAPPPAE
jgi:hypothetical protein